MVTGTLPYTGSTTYAAILWCMTAVLYDTQYPAGLATPRLCLLDLVLSLRRSTAIFKVIQFDWHSQVNHIPQVIFSAPQLWVWLSYIRFEWEC